MNLNELLNRLDLPTSVRSELWGNYLWSIQFDGTMMSVTYVSKGQTKSLTIPSESIGWAAEVIGSCPKCWRRFVSGKDTCILKGGKPACPDCEVQLN